MTLIRRFRSAAAIAAGLFCTTVAHSASLTPLPIIPFPTPLPLAPLLGQPAAGVQRGTLNNTRPTFTWTQGGLVTTFPQPAVANHFMVCVYPVGGSCTWPGTWSAAATNISRTEIIGLSGIRTGRYSYTFPAPSALPNNLLDTDVMWNVGACSTTAQSSCKLGTPRSAYFSTRNLTATDVQFDRTSSNTQGWIRADLIVKNDGTSASGAFTTVMILAEVLTSGGTCLTNPSAPGVQAGDEAILRDGSFVPISQLPANAMIVGITRWSLDLDDQLVQSSSLAAGAEFSVGYIDSYFTWRSGETERGYVGGGLADISLPGAPSVVREFAESDNTKFECKMVFK